MNLQRLQSLYSCNATQGLLISRRTGRAVGSVNGSGYLTVRVDGKQYYIHRIIFFMSHGYQPQLIDHINTTKVDNRISNLRDATPSQNQLNRPNVRGIYQRGSKWIAQYRNKYIGIYPTEAEAIQARRKASASMQQPTLRAA